MGNVLSSKPQLEDETIMEGDNNSNNNFVAATAVGVAVAVGTAGGILLFSRRFRDTSGATAATSATSAEATAAVNPIVSDNSEGKHTTGSSSSSNVNDDDSNNNKAEEVSDEDALVAAVGGNNVNDDDNTKNPAKEYIGKLSLLKNYESTDRRDKLLKLGRPNTTKDKDPTVYGSAYYGYQLYEYATEVIEWQKEQMKQPKELQIPHNNGDHKYDYCVFIELAEAHVGFNQDKLNNLKKTTTTATKDAAKTADPDDILEEQTLTKFLQAWVVEERRKALVSEVQEMHSLTIQVQKVTLLQTATDYNYGKCLSEQAIKLAQLKIDKAQQLLQGIGKYTAATIMEEEEEGDEYEKFILCELLESNPSGSSSSSSLEEEQEEETTNQDELKKIEHNTDIMVNIFSFVGPGHYNLMARVSQAFKKNYLEYYSILDGKEIEQPLEKKDILMNIFSFIGPGHYFFVAGVSKAFKKSYLEYYSKLDGKDDDDDDDDDDELVGDGNNNETNNKAVATDTFYSKAFANVDCANVWFDDVKSSEDCYFYQLVEDFPLCDIITKNGGKLEVFKWARRQGFSWKKSTCKVAAEHGRLQILKCAREFPSKFRCPWDEETSQMAFQNGHLDCFRYAIQNGCPCSRDIYVQAFEAGVITTEDQPDWVIIQRMQEFIQDDDDASSTT